MSKQASIHCFSATLAKKDANTEADCDSEDMDIPLACLATMQKDIHTREFTEINLLMLRLGQMKQTRTLTYSFTIFTMF